MAESVNATYKDCRLQILDESRVKYSDDYKQEAVGAVLKDELIRSTIDRFVYWIDNFGDPVEQRCKGEDLQILGQHLYNLLFDRESRENPETRERLSVHKCFERAYQNFESDHARDANLRLRVILTFYQDADSLAAYPWEFLHVPHRPESFFLAGKKTELILTRCVPEAGIKDKLDPEERPLKILIACSRPREEREVGADVVIDYINRLNKAGVIEVDVVEYPTFRNISSKLDRMKPHIFHFIGHGRTIPLHRPEIALMKERAEIKEDEDLQSPAERKAGRMVPQADWIESGKFAELFKNHRPRLVFLHACKGAAAGYKFHSTACDLVKAKIPAVVAMQYEISNDDANAFAQKFYQQIDAGKSVDEAVSEGRWELGIFPSHRGTWNDRGFGTPVIYLQSKGAVVTPRPREGTASDQGSEDSSVPSKVRCPYSNCPKGLVIPGRNFCATCHQPIILCPNCKSVTAPGFCDNCGWTEGGAPTVGSALTVRTDTQLQQGTSSIPNQHLPTPDEPTETKARSIEIRADLVQ